LKLGEIKHKLYVKYYAMKGSNGFNLPFSGIYLYQVLPR